MISLKRLIELRFMHQFNYKDSLATSRTKVNETASGEFMAEKSMGLIVYEVDSNQNRISSESFAVTQNKYSFYVDNSMLNMTEVEYMEYMQCVTSNGKKYLPTKLCISIGREANPEQIPIYHEDLKLAMSTNQEFEVLCFGEKYNLTASDITDLILTDLHPMKKDATLKECELIANQLCLDWTTTMGLVETNMERLDTWNDVCSLFMEHDEHIYEQNILSRSKQFTGGE